MPGMLATFLNELGGLGLTVVDQSTLPERAEQHEAVPPEYRVGRVGAWLSRFQKGLWRHQAEALRLYASGKNVVVSTGTASGKSLVFQATALKAIEDDDRVRVLVFYPLKALASDQLVSWRSVLRQADFPPDHVGRIDGGVLADERRKILQDARILLATPDVIHAWLMSNLSNPEHKRFLSQLRLVIIDEAHVLDGVFGSNFAYLFRRLCVAARMADRAREPIPIRAIAASATISNGGDHLRALTGLEFSAVGESSDGSPRYPSTLLHIATPNGEETAIAASVQKKLVQDSDSGSFITFVDSRQGAERLAIRTDDSLVRPYRSGYEASDREAIEEGLRSGLLRGVVSTSALELGINIPHFTVGMNIGVPASRKSFRQRLGRVGRQQEGAFVIFGDPYCFSRYGSSLQQYFDDSVEPCFLYLQNRFIQYAHARCLADELEALGVSGRKVLPAFVNWPDGFKNIFDFAQLGGPTARPHEFDPIHRIGGDSPHYNYPLRNIAEESFIVSAGGHQTGRRVGNLTLQQAIREAFPGAIYLHLAKGWKVFEWRSTTWERAIRVGETQSRSFPKPLLRTFVNISLEREGIVDGRFRSGRGGFLAECQLQITERVEGFIERGERKLYRDLQGQDPTMRAKTRDFRTTGVVLNITEPWFAARGVKEQLADALRELMIREYSISPSDIDAAATNVAIVREGQRNPASDVLVVYDAIHGSLRLTESAYTRLEHLMSRFRDSAEAGGPTGTELLPQEIVNRFAAWHAALDEENGDVGAVLPSDLGSSSGGWIQVYSPGSIVCKRGAQGLLMDIQILEPEVVPTDSGARLYYRYRTSTQAKALVDAQYIEPAGDEWSWTFWNPETGEYKDSTDDLVAREVDRPTNLGDSSPEPEP